MKKSLHSIFKKGYTAGYTLLEVLVVVGLISVASAGAYLVISNVSKDTTNTKLLQDVNTVNRAIALFQASGGSLTGITDPQQVVDRLKAKMDVNEAQKMAGMRSSLVDTRLQVVAQTSEQASSNQQRAYWSAATQAFYVAESGGVGIREFALDESRANSDYGTSERNSAFKLAVVKPWIWDTADGVANSKGPPRTNQTTITNPVTPINPNAPLVLRPPTFSVPGGEYPLVNFPIDLTLTNPNPPETSNIMNSVSQADWRIYVQSLLVNPSERVRAMAASLMPEKFSHSSVVQQTYTATPVTPEFELTFSKNAYSYVEMGGAIMPSNAPKTNVLPSGRLTLINGADIPDIYESSTYFQTKWTKDGSDPITSNTATPGPAFSNGFPGQDVPLTMTDFGTATTVTINAGAVTQNLALFKSSKVVTKSVGISVLKLRPPIITVSERDVTLSFDHSALDVPVGAYIHYTVDGSVPGVSAGAPTSGTLYSKPFKLEAAAGSTVTIKARVYPPPDYLAWFEASDAASKAVEMPVAMEFYVGGNFVLPNGTSGSGAPMRNIARLQGNGAVDPSFDVGTGASANSLVGVIRQVSSGNVFAGGDFDSVNNVPRPAVVRLKANGAVDPSFDAGLAGGK